ncbi:ornithine carbamoyltransferase [Fictibacillus barbaricus]|uniref:Ornithine carbamoyltransferase n=1 Tax=Fictibacillus barbaricus TaxID=182136 RepID=A0ABS2ZGL9_9BACL|nr:ornithine carbamoyltransferase [Fictibacillus barbaricus]MBN3547095.1 ornithine carbamoyltransferase [Fictibacillus barbaricus]GGB46401.1 ornithine carbamoyltransferase [Fictibacillus barbaricus]
MSIVHPLHSAKTKKDFLTLRDYSTDEIMDLLNLAKDLKKQGPGAPSLLKGKILGMIFEKSSTRTRVSFEAAMLQLGGNAIHLSTRDIQMGRGESIADTAKVLSGYLDGLMIRTFHQSTVEELAHNSSIPVINGLTDDFHPCQVLADLLTILEYKGSFKGKKLAYIGDGNNMAHSLMIGAAKVGMDCTIIAPKEYEPKKSIVSYAKEVAKQSGSTIEVTNDPIDGIKDSDVIYTDVWASMGQESETLERISHFEPFQVNQELVSNAKKDYIFMHCLPAHRGEEVTADIIDGHHSVVFPEAENRLHAQKALLVYLLS